MFVAHRPRGRFEHSELFLRGDAPLPRNEKRHAVQGRLDAAALLIAPEPTWFRDDSAKTATKRSDVFSLPATTAPSRPRSTSRVLGCTLSDVSQSLPSVDRPTVDCSVSVSASLARARGDRPDSLAPRATRVAARCLCVGSKVHKRRTQSAKPLTCAPSAGSSVNARLAASAQAPKAAAPGHASAATPPSINISRRTSPAPRQAARSRASGRSPFSGHCSHSRRRSRRASGRSDHRHHHRRVLFSRARLGRRQRRAAPVFTRWRRRPAAHGACTGACTGGGARVHPRRRR